MQGSPATSMGANNQVWDRLRRLRWRRQVGLYRHLVSIRIADLVSQLGRWPVRRCRFGRQVASQLFADVEWGVTFSDFDNDADQDVFIACGHFDRIEQIDDRSQQEDPQLHAGQ